MSYQVLARSWRPQRFADMLGQEAVVQTLRNALASGTLGHAYLFSGLRGVGKTTVARLLAKAVNCEHGPTPDPCGTCVPCREIAEGTALDVVELDGASNRGIDDVRELRELLRYRPSRDRYRVIIIDEVHMLTREAFNALLKSLEEPPPYILFVFATTERHKVPATILSRCQQLEFRPVPAELVASRLQEIAAEEGFELEAEAAGMIARAAGGSVRDALSLTDQLRAFSGDDIDASAVAAVLGVPQQERVMELLSAMVSGDAAAMLGGVREELRAGHDPTVLFEELGRHLRAVALVAMGAGDGEAAPPGAEELAARVPADGWARMLGIWLEQDRVLREAAHRELALEVAAMRLSRWPTVRRVEELLEGGEEPPAAGGKEEPPEGPAKPGTPGRSASPAEVLSEALWQRGRRRLAAAVREVEVRRTEAGVQLDVPATKSAVRRALEEHRAELAEVVGELWGCGLALAEGAAEADAGGGGSLREAALQDDGVRLAVEILGGTVEQVVQDREDGAEETPWT